MSTILTSTPFWVSLTSMVQNQRVLVRTLQSLLQQTLLPDRIILYLSTTPYLLDKGFVNKTEDFTTDLNELLLKNPIVEVKWTDNTGPYRKLAPLLKECVEENWDVKDVVIITVDDDTVYHPRLFERMLNDYHVHGGLASVNYRGFLMDVSRGLAEISYERRAVSDRKLNLCNFATGKGGVLYHPRHFSREVYDILFNSERWNELCPTNDDIWWNFCRMASGTPLYLNNEVPYMKTDLTQSVNLFAHTNRETNTQWMARAGKWFFEQFPTFAMMWPARVVPLSTQFWCDRYARGESDSAANLYGDFLPQFLRSRKVTTVLDYGCGDGRQTRFFLGACPIYVGIDPSPHAIEQCKKRLSHRQTGEKTCFFLTIDEFHLVANWDVTLSLNVLPFLDEEEVRTEYLRRLFGWSHLYVVIFYPVLPSRRRASVLSYIENEFVAFRLNQQTESGFLVYKRVADERTLIQSVEPLLVDDIDCIQLVQYLRLLRVFRQMSHTSHTDKLTVWTDDEAIARIIRVTDPDAYVDSPSSMDETAEVSVSMTLLKDGTIRLDLTVAPTRTYDLVYLTNRFDPVHLLKRRHRGTVWVLPHAVAQTTWLRKELRDRRVQSNESLDWFMGRRTSWWTCVR